MKYSKDSFETLKGPCLFLKKNTPRLRGAIKGDCYMRVVKLDLTTINIIDSFLDVIHINLKKIKV